LVERKFHKADILDQHRNGFVMGITLKGTMRCQCVESLVLDTRKTVQGLPCIVWTVRCGGIHHGHPMKLDLAFLNDPYWYHLSGDLYEGEARY